MILFDCIICRCPVAYPSGLLTSLSVCETCIQDEDLTLEDIQIKLTDEIDKADEHTNLALQTSKRQEI